MLKFQQQLNAQLNSEHHTAVKNNLLLILLLPYTTLIYINFLNQDYELY